MNIMHPNKLSLLSADGKVESPSNFAICDYYDSGKFENSDSSIKVQESSNYHNSSIHYECRSKRIHESEFHNYSWHIPKEFSNTVVSASTSNSNPSIIYHKDVMNFARIISNSNSNVASSSVSAVSTPRSPKYPITHCVMCGRQDVTIPSQNKHICKICDSSYWLYLKYSFIFKFCKGCKNFFPLSEFADKPEGTKCYKCRQRGRDNYLQKKNQLDLNVLINMNSTSEKSPEEFPLANSPPSLCTLLQQCEDVPFSKPSNKCHDNNEKLRRSNSSHDSNDNHSRVDGVPLSTDFEGKICKVEALLSSPYDRTFGDTSLKKKNEPRSSGYKSAFLARIMTPAATKSSTTAASTTNTAIFPRTTIFGSPPDAAVLTPSNAFCGSTSVRSGLTSVETNDSNILSTCGSHEIRSLDETCDKREEESSSANNSNVQAQIYRKRNRSFSIAEVSFDSCTTDYPEDLDSTKKSFRVESPVSFSEGNPLMTLAMLTSSEKLTSP